MPTTPGRNSPAAEARGSEKPADEEYKRVILLLRAELGKAREELVRLKEGKREGEGKDDDASAKKLILRQEEELLKTKEALATAQAELRAAENEANAARQHLADEGRSGAKMSAVDAENIMLRAERDDLKEEIRVLQEKMKWANQELAKEVSAHARAQQSHMSLEAQLNNLEEQVQTQVQQQAQVIA